MKTIRLAALAMLVLMAADAHATFHAWRMTEIYSNADGSVQFLELASPVDGEEFLNGHELYSTFAGTTRVYTFRADLPFGTGGKRMLIATQGFAALGVLTPDYVVPNGFFSASGGRVNFADVDVWDYPRLPSSGGLSLDRDGSTSVNSPMNFAGKTITVADALPFNVQALWWGSPAGSESGWGLNIAHQGDTLFATWFTYDTNRAGMWLVLSNGVKVNANTYQGDLYRTTGTPFNLINGAISVNLPLPTVGTLSFTFLDGITADMRYTVNGVTQTKRIQRQQFALPYSSCR